MSRQRRNQLVREGRAQQTFREAFFQSCGFRGLRYRRKRWARFMRFLSRAP